MQIFYQISFIKIQVYAWHKKSVITMLDYCACRTTAGKGRKVMKLEVVKEKNPNFLYLYGRGTQEVYTSES